MGCQVEVVGLESKPEWNGQVGQIFFYDAEKGRYMVLIDGAPSTVGLHPRNCVHVKGACVTLQGLNDEQLNGKMAQIVGVDRRVARYIVQCCNGRQVKVKFENVLC